MTHLAVGLWILATAGGMYLFGPSRALVPALFSGWLLLPEAAPGLPEKQLVVNVTLALTSFAAAPQAWFRLRLGWRDLPWMVFSVAPFLVSLANDLGAYDGGAMVYRTFFSLPLALLIGRVFCGTEEGLRKLAVGFVAAGLLYVPLCLLEVRLSPQLHVWVYGYHQHDFGQQVRFGGFRPMVFMAHGLVVGLFISFSTLAAFWLWRTRALTHVLWLPARIAPLVLGATLILCKAAGAWMLAIAGFVALREVGRGRKWLVGLLVVVPLLYCTARVSGLWSGQTVVDLTGDLFGDERAGSFRFRLQNEDLLIAHALERPFLGWGQWGRNRVLDESGHLAITDGWWIILFGVGGWVSLGSVLAIFLLPLTELWRRLPQREILEARHAPAVVLGVLASLFMIDQLPNGMPLPMSVVGLGGVLQYAKNLGRDPGATGKSP